MRILELFSGTHSVGKVFKEHGYEVVSVDGDLTGSCPLGSGYESEKHFQEDIMTWNYKQYPEGYFKVITASPVCLWWSNIRSCWIGRKCKTIHPTDIITPEHIMADIEKYGKPMVDKIFEIIEYFKPEVWWIENPHTGKMKNYISEKYPQYDTYYNVDYCKYCDWGYKKRTRFWTNLKDFKPKICHDDCDNIVQFGKIKRHKHNIANNQYIIDDGKKIFLNHKVLRDKYKDHTKYNLNKEKVSLYDRYRIPENLIEEFLKLI